jgi:hypothetical protein
MWSGPHDLLGVLVEIVFGVLNEGPRREVYGASFKRSHVTEVVQKPC